MLSKKIHITLGLTNTLSTHFSSPSHERSLSNSSESFSFGLTQEKSQSFLDSTQSTQDVSFQNKSLTLLSKSKHIEKSRKIISTGNRNSKVYTFRKLKQELSRGIQVRKFILHFKDLAKSYI